MPTSMTPDSDRANKTDNEAVNAFNKALDDMLRPLAVPLAFHVVRLLRDGGWRQYNDNRTVIVGEPPIGPTSYNRFDDFLDNQGHSSTAVEGVLAYLLYADVEEDTTLDFDVFDLFSKACRIRTNDVASEAAKVYDRLVKAYGEPA
ncbi:MAG TPA: hypothetical protein VGS97_09640 [Actinocrinis sp.]|uniref:hypothetical protein n=1 Tax=Actinocrinis sp. TaxID=1920516 RepID=UPI002DDDB532|nr:hypothetical protein [Actinocrinis sp.]HEV2344342.1 hypothetical protein [Actinocrinis sp.]